MDAQAILKSAMLNEWDGLHFYTRAARQLSDARGKKMIETLIADERVHVGVIAAQYDSIAAGKGWLALAEAKKECRLPDVAKKFGVKPGATCEGLERIFPSGANSGPQANGCASCPPRAAYSHSASVGIAFPAHAAYAAASSQATCSTGCRFRPSRLLPGPSGCRQSAPGIQSHQV